MGFDAGNKWELWACEPTINAATTGLVIKSPIQAAYHSTGYILVSQKPEGHPLSSSLLPTSSSPVGAMGFISLGPPPFVLGIWYPCRSAGQATKNWPEVPRCHIVNAEPTFLGVHLQFPLFKSSSFPTCPSIFPSCLWSVVTHPVLPLLALQLRARSQGPRRLSHHLEV